MPTKLFKWIDRDTAARDMLQLVYHAPPQIAEQAVKLLRAIRSPAIMPELKAMFLDQEYDKSLRREIYNVICATPGNFDFSEFESTNLKVLISHFSFDLLKNHPINITWIVPNVEVKSVYMQLYNYSKIMEFVPEIAGAHILKILSENETPFGKDLGFQLYKFGDQTLQILLEENWERIIQSWLIDDLEYENEYWQRLRGFTFRSQWLDKWSELREALTYIQLGWLLDHINSQNPLSQRRIAFRLLPYASKTASDLLVRLIEEKQLFLDLEAAGLLHKYGDEIIQKWLVARWEELIYLCLIDSVGVAHHLEKVRIIHILEKWPELKAALFQHAPTMVEEYTRLKLQYESYDDFFGSISDDNIRQHPIWQSIEKHHHEWLEPNKHISGVSKDLYNRDYLTSNSEADIPQVAVKTHILGTAIDIDTDSTGWLSHLLLESVDQWRDDWTSEIDGGHLIFVYTPVRFEAAYALRNVAKPQVWGDFVEAFLAPKNDFRGLTNRMFERHMLRWISRMTDMLSGVEPELPDEEIPLNARPWFRALVQGESNIAKV